MRNSSLLLSIILHVIIILLMIAQWTDLGMGNTGVVMEYSDHAFMVEIASTGTAEIAEPVADTAASRTEVREADQQPASIESNDEEKPIDVASGAQSLHPAPAPTLNRSASPDRWHNSESTDFESSAPIVLPENDSPAEVELLRADVVGPRSPVSREPPVAETSDNAPPAAEDTDERDQSAAEEVVETVKTEQSPALPPVESPSAPSPVTADVVQDEIKTTATDAPASTSTSATQTATQSSSQQSAQASDSSSPANPGESQIDEPSLMPASATGDTRPDLALTPSELEQLREQLFKCWKLPPNLDRSDNVRVFISATLSPAGLILDNEIDRRRGSVEHPMFDVVAESALRAVLDCAPFKLPIAKYEAWRNLGLTFESRFAEEFKYGD